MDKEAFADVVLSSTDSLYRISKSILKNDADCEDAVQEAIATGFGKLSTLRQDAYAKTWLTRISQDLEIIGFDASSPTMTLIPVRVQWDADGSQIPDSREVLENCAITIELTK